MIESFVAQKLVFFLLSYYWKPDKTLIALFAFLIIVN